MKVRKWKRILAFMVCICMLMGSVQVPVYASEENNVENIFQTEEEKKDAESQTENTVPEIEKDTTETESGSGNEMTGTEQKTEDTDSKNDESSLNEPLEQKEEIYKDSVETEPIVPEESVEDNDQSVSAQLQARINALPDLETWNILCENQNEEYIAVNTEIKELCRIIQDTYGLNVEADVFDPSGDYSAQCPLDLTKLIEILYPQTEELLNDEKQGNDKLLVTKIPDDKSFDEMCQDIFGQSASAIKNNEKYSEVYVGSTSGGEQTGTPGTEKKPYESLEAAYNGVAGAQKAGAVIHLLDSYQWEQDQFSFWPTAEVPVIIISDAYTNIFLNMSVDTWDFKANTGFYNVQIKLTYEESKNGVMHANGHTVVFGGHQKNNFAFQNDSATRSYPTLFGAGGESSGTSSKHGQVENTNLKVYGGKWAQIFGGGYKYSDVTGIANVTVDGSYCLENNEIISGAVTFSDTNLVYMEGSSNIYGGGAGDYTLLSSSENSNVNASVVNLSYLTTNKYVTPCGGWMGTSAAITLNYVTAKGVNARSEGSTADKVDFIIQNSSIHEKVGALGSSQKDVTSAYIFMKQISDFNITIEGSTITGAVAVKSGGISGADYNNSVTGVNLIIKNSTVGTLAMAELPAEYNKGTVELIHLEKSIINKYFSGANFETLKKIVLKDMGDFQWKDFLFSAKYNPSNSISEMLCVENTNVKFQIPYETGNLNLSNGTITLDSDLTLNVESYTGQSGSKLEMYSGASMIVSGIVSGAGTTVIPKLDRENSNVQITWKRAEGSDNLDFFTKDEETTRYSEKKVYVPTMNLCCWYNYELKENSYIYVDGQNGHDNISEYNNDCTEETLGYDAKFPVKTLGKAHDLCKNQNDKIVICGPYEIQVTEKELPLIENGKNKNFPVTITSKDDFFDYRGKAYIKFVGSGESGRLDLQEEIIFDTIDFITELPTKSSMRIFSNGYKTVYGEGVTAKTPEDVNLELYGGAYEKGVTSTDLSVRALNVNRVSAGGYGSNSYVGDKNNNKDINKQVVAKLDVNLTQKYSTKLYVDFIGNAYGSVKQTFNFNHGSLSNLYLYFQTNNNNIIYGDFITDLSANDVGGTIYGYVSPSSQTVKGDVKFTDSGNNNYQYLYVGYGTYQNVDITIKSNVKDVNLFNTGTNAKEVNWTLSGDVNSVYGYNNNSYLENNSMKLNVELDATGNTMIKAGDSGDTDSSKTGYRQLENVSVTLKNFDVSHTISTLQGFGSVTFDHCLCLVNAELYTTNLSVQNSSQINFMQKVVVGQQTKAGKLSLLNHGCMIMNNELSLQGDMIGETEKTSAGMLENNWVNEQDTTEQITVNGTTTGYIYYTTSYEEAKIQVTGNTTGKEYIAPEAVAGIPAMTIQCKPEISESVQVNRIWTITNPVSKKVIFVNGSVNKDNYSIHDGSTPERAYATLEEGYEEVLNGGTIVICGDTFVSSWPVNPKVVTITSKITIGTGENAISYDYFSGNNPASFSMDQKSVELKNDTVFEYLNIKNSNVVTIGACGHKLTMGHSGDEKSLKMSGQPLNVGGGTNTTVIKEGINTDVTIHAGTYGTASGTNSYNNYGNETRYLSVKIQILGGIFDKVFIKGNLYDLFDKMTSFPTLIIENAEIKTSMYAVECNYSVGKIPYQMNIGKNMKFSENSMIGAGTNRANYEEVLTVKLSINGSGGTPYTIPVISTGKSNGEKNIKTSSAEISIKGVKVERFYGGLSANSSISAEDISTTLSLDDNVTVDQLYFGGKNTAGKEMRVNVCSDSVIINTIISGSENNKTEIPEVAELNFVDIGLEKKYELQSGVSLNGLTKVTVQNSDLDITNAGPDITLGTLDVSKGNLTYRKNNLKIIGNYIGGTGESPTTFYGWRSPKYTIEGTVSGETQVRSLATDPSSNNEITGKFYYGLVISASYDISHSENTFQCLQNAEEDPQKLVFKGMSFTKGSETVMDQWKKETEEDSQNFTQIFVSAIDGSDDNQGTYASPVKTIAKAYECVNQLFTSNNTKKEWEIILLDDITYNENMSAALSGDYRVTIKSESESVANRLILKKNFHIPVDTTFDNIIIKSNSTGDLIEIFANGHNVICSDKLEVEAVDRHYPRLFGGNDDKDSELTETNLTVYGGTWNQIFGGSKYAKVSTSNLILGKNADTFHIGAIDETSTGVFGGGMYGATDTINLTVDGGTYFRMFGGGMNSGASSGDIHLKFNSGVSSRLYGGGQYAQTNGNIQVDIGEIAVGTRKEGKKETATITGIYRGSGLYAGLAGGKKAVTNIYSHAIIEENTQFAAGGYSGTLDCTELHIYGGIVNCDLYAGGWGEGNDGTYGTVNSSSLVEVNGGTINGNIYGGGKLAVVTNASENAEANVRISGGTIKGNIYGGGNAAGVNKSNVTISSDVVGNIFGGSENITAEALQVQKSSDVKLGTCTITGSVFGGSDTSGLIKTTVDVTTQGKVTIAGEGNGVYGGGSKAPLNITPKVIVSAGSSVTGNMYGGGKGEVEGILGRTANFFHSFLSLFDTTPSYNIAGLTDANVPSTNIVISGTVEGNVYGGGEMATVGNEETASWDTDVTQVVLNEGATITGNIYGGGKGQQGKDYAVVYGNTKVELNGGSVTVANAEESNLTAGSVFGGSEIAPVAGKTSVTVKGGTFSNIFAGNDVSGEINGETLVEIPANVQANITHVYGGGREAIHKNKNMIRISGGIVTDVYGGGYGQGAESSETDVQITGGTIETAYAGGNSATVTDKAELILNTGKDQKCVGTIFSGNNQAAMSIQPVMKLVSGQCDTFYGGGNQGDMTIDSGLKYGADTFGSSEVSIGTVYGGCNNADVIIGVELTFTQGNYTTVYGGNNAGGEARTATVILDEGIAKQLNVAEVYGGGNRADIQNTQVKVVNGTFPSVYGGGNQATVTKQAVIQLGENDSANTEKNPSVTHLFGGNNNADMAIQPEFSLLKGKAENVYGGCNKGKMTKEQLSFTFTGEAEITNLYGGCNEADVTGKLQMILKNLPVENAYGGCNTMGHIQETEVVVQGTGAKNIFGGGRGNQTSVDKSHVKVQNGTVFGNVYGGSGYGYVKDASVTVKEETDSLFSTEKPKIVIEGNVFGGGYGVDSVVENTHVTVDMNLSIGSGNNVDLMVTEAKADTTDSTADGGKDASSGETQTKVELKNTDISTIEGSVYGGGDMGKVGDGMIHQATNTATIETPGTTDVQILGGNIVGSVFGGGSGTPAAGESYTIYMGTVFGKCNTTVQGGYIKGSIYGCGHQSRVYASDIEGKKQAAEVKIQEVNDKSVVIGTSIFGGGNKGEGANQNASVYTVVGDTSVIIDGLDNKSNSTAIYFLSDSKGGVYGDGNLCLVKGNRMIQISDFNYGANNHELLKTFYSLQRADQVTLTRTKIVLRGAKDLVDENADETVYAINRVGNLELKESSTVKLTTIVKLLGGLSSDQNTDTVYIDRGHNGENSYTNRGGTDPTEKLTKDSITQYRTAYADYIENKSSGNAEYKSFNVICVANGDYLEVKKSDSEYGNVTGLFTLELLHANPGEGGGFVFANIGDPKTSGTESGTENAGSTGDFICVTKNSADGNDYMEIMDTVGGYSGTDYTYYYWYIKGGKYTYNTNLQGYIGTSDTTFEAGARMPELRQNYHYILNKITGSELTDSSNSTNQFAEERWKDSWNEEQMKEMDAYAIEIQMVPRGKETQELKSLGYLAYGTEGWYIKQDNNASLVGTGDSNQTAQDTLKKNDIFEVTEGMTGLELKFILHKGSGVTVEIKNVPIIMEFDVLGETTNGEYQTGNGGENAHVKIQTYTSITRIVPSQAIYMSGGRMYAGVSSDMQPSITGNSAFTAQVITKYVPSAFNSTGSKVKEVLTASYDEIYMIDEQRGIGFTVRETENGIDLIYATEGNKEDYEITKDVGGAYKVTYKEKNETGASGQTTNELKMISANQGSFIFPKGTKITLVAQMDDFTPTYWYYYVTEENKKDISLQDFKKMNTVSSTNNQYSFENASEGKITCLSSNRVTENLTFVFDFSEVEKSVATEAEKVLSGSILLRHQATIGSYTNVDIMDFVSKNTTMGTDGNPVVQYSRETPKISEPFKVSQDETGIKEFTIQPTSQEYYEKDTYEFQIDIQEDETWMNTQYEEREYAVVLELVETTGNGSTEQVKKFPEGTTFWYQGNRISAGQENSSVIIPVKEEGKHLVTVQTELQGFTTGENKIRASLYSSSVASYYNSISTSQKAEAVFNVIKTPEIALSVSGSGNKENTLLQPGESIQLAVSSTGQIKSQQKVIVTLYQYQTNTKNYRKMQLDQIFETPTAELELGDAIWKTRIKEQAEPGTYRLEFQYGDKTEYWDFIIS